MRTFFLTGIWNYKPQSKCPHLPNWTFFLKSPSKKKEYMYLFMLISWAPIIILDYVLMAILNIFHIISSISYISLCLCMYMYVYTYSHLLVP